jgi:hypothetical protein
LAELENPASLETADYGSAPFWLVKLGARDEARHAIELIQERELFPYDHGSFEILVVKLLGIGGDPLIQDYLARGRRYNQEYHRRFAP